MIKKILFLVLIFSTAVFSKEIFDVNKIKVYLTEENPYIYLIIGKKYIYEGKLKYYLGNFDTTLSGKLEKKDYPISSSEFYSLFLNKPTKSGVDLLLGYRKATGVQEYSNVKTSESGEVQLGLKIPVLSVFQNIDLRRLNIYKGNLDIAKIDFEFRDKLRKLYFKIVSEYYKTLYYRSVLNLEKELLKKAEKRKNIILKKVEKGSLPKAYLLEAQQHIINREQRLIIAENDFNNQLSNFLKYLNLTNEEFLKKYQLPDLPEPEKADFDLEKSLEIAIKRRPDLKALEVLKKQINYETKYYTLMKYPKINLSLYGVVDFKYDAGYKFSVDMKYPFERRKYLGKVTELNKNRYLINKEKEKIVIELKTNLKNIIASILTALETYENSKKEIELVKKLEEFEKKKFYLGASNLFLVNQREIYTLKTIKKNLKYKLEYFILYYQYLKEINSDFYTI